MLTTITGCSDKKIITAGTPVRNQSFYLSAYKDNTVSDDAVSINKMISDARRQKCDIYFDVDATIYSPIVLEECEGLSIYFIQGSTLFQRGIPVDPHSIENGKDFYPAILIRNSREIKLFDLKCVGENPDQSTLYSDGDAACVHIESTGFRKDGKPNTQYIHIIRPVIEHILGSGIRSFSGWYAQDIFISDGYFSNLGKTGVNCNAEGLIVRNCVFEYCRGGIEVANSSHLVIDGNKISFCEAGGLAVGGHYSPTIESQGLLNFQPETMHPSLGRQMGVKVINNTIYKCGGGLKGDKSNGPGISVTIGTTYPIISNNHVYFSGRSGIQVSEASLPTNPIIGPVIHDNVLISNGHITNTGPNAGIYSDVPIVAYSNYIETLDQYTAYRQDYGIYIIDNDRDTYPYASIALPRTIYNNTIRCKVPILMEHATGELLNQIKNQNIIFGFE